MKKKIVSDVSCHIMQRFPLMPPGIEYVLFLFDLEHYIFLSNSHFYHIVISTIFE